MANGHLIHAELGGEVGRIFGALSDNPLTRRVETTMMRQMRDALIGAMVEAVKDAQREGAFPNRTGVGYRKALAGGRAFGTRFKDLRGHLLAPDYIVAHQRGTLITPVEAPQLAIPLPAALRPDGTPKLLKPSSWTLYGSFIYKSKRNGRGYIARKGPTGELILLYVFVDEAQLRKHKGFITKPWDKNLAKLFDKFGLIFMAAIESFDVEEFVEMGRRTGTKIGGKK